MSIKKCKKNPSQKKFSHKLLVPGACDNKLTMFSLRPILLLLLVLLAFVLLRRALRR